ncbi:uncharacterized protein VTP21DRAFT_10682 [Calcarisporiella thermophila]|uniref:uncharacterized protein n=1 Tax=Calcarisporiella thermophila TaxID=911321 RepID=UPI003742F12C
MEKDPSEWSSPELSDIDHKLRCPICKDHFQAAVMLIKCSHNFCSLCIRRSLNLAEVCPVCRTPSEESHIQKNILLDDLVQSFSRLRSFLLKGHFLKVNNDTDSATAITEKSEKISTKELDSQGVLPQTKQRSTSTGTGFPCPICGNLYSPSDINSHLDRCLMKSNPPTSSPASSPSAINTLSTPSSSNGTRTKLTKLCYSVYTDKQLRKILKDLNLPTNGDRQLLQYRHREFLNLHNANCDSQKPRSHAELLKELETLERIYTKEKNNKKPGRISTEQEAAAHVEKYADQFSELIEQIRQREAKKKAQEDESGESEALDSTPAQSQPSTLSDEPSDSTPKLTNSRAKKRKRNSQPVDDDFI